MGLKQRLTESCKGYEVKINDTCIRKIRQGKAFKTIDFKDVVSVRLTARHCPKGILKSCYTCSVGSSQETIRITNHIAGDAPRDMDLGYIRKLKALHTALLPYSSRINYSHGNKTLAEIGGAGLLVAPSATGVLMYAGIINSMLVASIATLPVMAACGGLIYLAQKQKGTYKANSIPQSYLPICDAGVQLFSKLNIRPVDKLKSSNWKPVRKNSGRSRAS